MYFRIYFHKNIFSFQLVIFEILPITKNKV